MNSADGAAAVFLDKDGTLVENVPYNVDPRRMVLTPGAGEALADLQEAGYRLLVVSNQSGVARGLFPEEALAGVRRRLGELLNPFGVVLDDFRYCPHHPEGVVAEYARECSCRKPGPGMLLQAAREHGIDLARSWLVGDILDDVEAGCRAGCRSILIDNGGETEWLEGECRTPTAVADGMQSAARTILSSEYEAGSRGASAPTHRTGAARSGMEAGGSR